MGYMLDTNIFNRLAEGALFMGDLPINGEFFATSIQIQELNATKDHAYRAILIAKFTEMGPKLDRVKTTLWGYASWSEGSWGGVGDYFRKIKDEMDMLNKNKASNSADALIGEVSISNHHTLITTDKHLAEVVEKHGGGVLKISC